MHLKNTLVFWAGLACVASVSVRFRNKILLVLVSFLARSKPTVPFHDLFLLRKQTETLATQARAGWIAGYRRFNCILTSLEELFMNNQK